MTVTAARRIPDMQPGTPLARLLDKVTPGRGNCWIWTGTVDRKGYGQTWIDGSLPMAHRVSYELHVGPIPDGLDIDHVKARGCTSRRCINPDHLEPVSHRVNVLRGSSPSALPHNSGRCQRGHDWAMHSVPNGRHRTCGACKRDRRAA